MRTLYHFWISPACRKVRLALSEKGLKFELKIEKPWERRPGFLARNPSGEVPILIDENVHKGRHMKDITDLESLHSPLITAIEQILERGEKDGLFRSGQNPEQLYISIAALGFFYFSNIYTLSAIFGHKLDTRENIAERKEHVVKLITDAIVN